MWGCTAENKHIKIDNTMVPTHVGVYRDLETSITEYSNGPHACGGVPNILQH